MKFERSFGILAHPTSFPGPYGIGDLGGYADTFIEFLKLSGARLWQVLPLGPTSFGDSPYQSFSTFAGNYYLISPDILYARGYLTEDDFSDIPAFPEAEVEYGDVIIFKMKLFRKAFAAFKNETDGERGADYARFCEENSGWLDDYAIFVALKEYFIEARRFAGESEEYLAYRENNKAYLTDNQIDDYYYGAVWNSWPKALASRDAKALAEWSEKLAEQIEFVKFLQYEFFREWNLVKASANSAGISLIGDIPIFVAMDSSDVWAAPGLFLLDENGYPASVAGVPPDYFSEDGQLWGNPLYDWPVHAKSGYAWWISRIGNALKTVDILRIDHFRGFESYWDIPYGERTAINGHWELGPGRDFFDVLKQEMGDLPIIAEDLGIITPEVHALRHYTGLPGMKVLQFAYGSDSANTHLPHNYTDTGSVIYTGTHDNDTTKGWYASAGDEEKDYVRRILNVSGEDINWDFIRQAFASTSVCAVIPLQDVLGLGSEARMNTPGTSAGNWRFRFAEEMVKPEMGEGLRYLAEMFNRVEADEEGKEV
ncbi:MAG: 4-alpha-glucanotransferase [Defluviitaleaceae bacterium]|nr:4-alpha-glucanotransferase [Defluviitaleaceae bacterium]